jgi:hypothetical protein
MSASGMHWRRTTNVVAHILVVVLFGNVAAATAQPAAVTFDPDDAAFTCEDTLTIAVHIDAAVTDLRGYSLVLAFASDVIAPLNVEPGELLVDAGCPYFFTWLNPAAEDSLAVDAATLGCSVCGPGEIMRIEFAGVADGNTILSCGSGRLRDGDNEAIVHVCGEAAILFTCPIAQQRYGWGTVKAWYR